MNEPRYHERMINRTQKGSRFFKVSFPWSCQKFEKSKTQSPTGRHARNSLQRGRHWREWYLVYRGHWFLNGLYRKRALSAYDPPCQPADQPHPTPAKRSKTSFRVPIELGKRAKGCSLLVAFHPWPGQTTRGVGGLPRGRKKRKSGVCGSESERLRAPDRLRAGQSHGESNDNRITAWRSLWPWMAKFIVIHMGS